MACDLLPLLVGVGDRRQLKNFLIIGQRSVFVVHSLKSAAPSGEKLAVFGFELYGLAVIRDCPIMVALGKEGKPPAVVRIGIRVHTNCLVVIGYRPLKLTLHTEGDTSIVVGAGVFWI